MPDVHDTEKLIAQAQQALMRASIALHKQTPEAAEGLLRSARDLCSVAMQRAAEAHGPAASL